MIYVYGFPTDQTERDDLEQEMVAEAEERAQREVKGNLT